ncbi:hypothetical protein [Enterococcus sp. DIV0756]|uniref:hypothetical protein n=1 Tax=Enterococcus sp. DIV0756 TaxID=2774636 RepID=UPI003F206146
MITYKQEKKEESRLRIWKKAISTLTNNREKETLINENVIREMWHYTFEQSVSTKRLSDYFSIDSSILADFCGFINRTNETKYPEDLKIIYFCGPEPENDLNIMLKLGVKIENICAIEQENTLYNKAIRNVKEKFPTLKIYKMRFKNFCESFPKQKFDIIYLDFTASLFNTNNVETIHYVFDYNMLENFGILVTNNSVPSKEDIKKNSEKYNELLTSFFVKQEKIEPAIIGEEGCYAVLSAEYKDNKAALLPDIKKFFYQAYSSFCTLYPIFYSNHVSPVYKIFKNKILSSFLIDENKVGVELSKNYRGEKMSSYFVHNLISEWKNKNAMYENKESGTQRNRIQSIDIVAEILNSSFYELNCTFVAEPFKNAIESSYKIMNIFEEKRFFCDIVFLRTLVEFTIFQLGYPYHVNYTNHERFSYRSKVNEMNVDIFTFDSCRSIYDWYPLFELYENNINLVEKQIILRMCLDLISGKQATNAPIGNYKDACNMIAVNEPFKMKFFSGFTPREYI